MKIVKLTHPSDWSRFGHWDYSHHTPHDSCIWGEYRFEINNEVTECDFWVIHGNIDKKERVSCPLGATVLVTAEERSQVPTIHSSFVNQFGTVVTSRDDIKHSHLVRKHYLCPWSIQKNYSSLVNSPFPTKEKEFSAIISNNRTTEGHRKRFDLTIKLKKHFKDKLDWYCKGESSFVKDKWDGLYSHAYSLCIENSSHWGYFTEKIMDCYLAYTMPIYWGCPNIQDYFPEKSYVLLDIDDTDKSIKRIEQAIDEDWYMMHFDSILVARKLVLNQYQFIPAICSVLDHIELGSTKKRITLQPENVFTKGNILKRLSKLF